MFLYWLLIPSGDPSFQYPHQFLRTVWGHLLLSGLGVPSSLVASRALLLTRLRLLALLAPSGGGI